MEKCGHRSVIAYSARGYFRSMDVNLTTRLNEIPTNHNPHFAPVIHPTLQTGVEALVVAARAWLAP